MALTDIAFLNALYRPIYWVVLLLAALALFGLAWRFRIRWWPAWLLRLGLVALVLLGVFAPQPELARGEVPQRQVLVVDQSDSLSDAARQSARQQAQEWQAARDNRLLVAYGSQPQAVLPATGETAREWPSLDGRASNLEDALSLANSLLGEAPGRVLLASDGQVETPGGVDAVVARMVEGGHTLDVMPLPARDDPDDGYLGQVWAPSNLWEGTPFDVVVPVYAPPSADQTVLTLQVNGQPSPTQAERLVQGPLSPVFYRFRVPAQAEGITTLQVEADFWPGAPGTDPFPANNTAFAALQVFAAPRVMFVTSANSAYSDRFVHGLRQNNLQVDVIAPRQIPTDMQSLQNYRVIFLHDLLSSQISQEQMLSLQVFVSRLAGGLVFLGGRGSYTLGGYQGTALEPILPVKLEPPPRSERPPIVFVLVMDRSSSMSRGGPRGLDRPIDLAREAAMRAIETMYPQDYLGVLTFTDEYVWDVPLRILGDGLALREALDAVSQVRASGGTRMFQALQEALGNLMALPGTAPLSRHILVLSDGQSFDGSPEEFQALAAFAQQQGITISTIALGAEADAQVMESIAEAGKGRYYPVAQAADLPRIMVYESQAARSENVQAGLTGLKLGEPDHPILAGMSTSQLPLVGGYNALTSRAEEGAEDVLVSGSFGDPLLSAWQYGLGRVVAWTSDLGEEWVENWPNPAAEGQFWTQVVRYSLVNPALGPAQVSVQVEDTHLSVDAALFNSQGEPVNLAQVVFTFAEAGGQTRSYSLPQTEAGLYHLEIPRPVEGAYRALVAYSANNRPKVEVAAPFAVNPPAEWLPADPAAGLANLEAWAGMTGGQALSLEEALHPPEAMTPETAEAPPAGEDWKQRLLLALVILWPVEIAIRRRWLPWG